MKLLIYGIDGGDLEIMKIFKDQMPFFTQLVEKNNILKVEEDLFSRGWAEILTGQHGANTRAFYMSPLLNGTHKFSTKFSINELVNNKNIRPIWDLLEESEVKYLIMNVPTSTPVPKVNNGIVVGSGGGGLNKVVGIPDNLVSDSSVKAFLEERGYIVDLRIPNKDIYTVDELLLKLNEMELKRTELFIELSKQKEVEFGFLVNRGTTILEYLSRSEIEDIKNKENIGSDFHEKLKEHFRKLDFQISSLFKELKPDNFIITSDHGIEPHKYLGSVNPFLKDLGLLKVKKGSLLLSLAKNLVIKLGLKKSSLNMVKKAGVKFQDSLKEINWSTTKVFGHPYVSGLYINDNKRFGGPVKEKEVNKLTQRVCDFVNANQEFKEKGITAAPYREKYVGSTFENHLPDIIFENLNGVYFDNKGLKTFRKNPNYDKVPKLLKDVNVNPFTGEKGKHPLTLVSNDCLQLIDQNDTMNLTLVYKIAERLLEMENR